jgi:hypothetical protein
MKKSRAMIAVSALLGLFTLSATAEIMPHPSSQFCGSVKEVEAALSDFDKILEGVAGQAGKQGVGEVWLNVKTGDWFFIQRTADQKVSCIVLGGSRFTHSVKGNGI